jgi:hypothetical protein
MKANRAGRPCPPWCRAVHQGRGATYSCIRSWPEVETPAAVFGVLQYLGFHDDAAPEVLLSATAPDGFSVRLGLLSRNAARTAAQLAEFLADATAEDHRAIAALIRAAAGEAFGEAKP